MAKTKESEIAKILNSFTENLQGLITFVKSLEPSVIKYDNELINKVERVFKKIEKISGAKRGVRRSKGKRNKVELTEEQALQIEEAFSELPRLYEQHALLLYKSSFVLLISYFDFLLSDLLHFYYKKYPESVPGKELSITLNELRLCDDLSVAMDSVINKKIESILYGGLESQKEHFKRELKVDIGEEFINWSKINEAVERRNLIVHNNGIINKRYLSSVDLSVITKRAGKIKEGKQITIDEAYFNDILKEFFMAGIILGQSCWRKWGKDELELVASELINDMYDALLEEKWEVAERLGLFSKKCETYDNACRLYLDINYCQSLKWQNKNVELRKELERFDISIVSPIYKVAIYALKSDMDNFFKSVEEAIRVDKMEKEDFMTWPLFRGLRQEADYAERIDGIFAVISKDEERESD